LRIGVSVNSAHQSQAADQLAPNVYFDERLGKQAAKILPGEFYVTSRDMALVTVLGSCVAACIRDPGTGAGGMNHFMLPAGGGDKAKFASTSARYGGYAMELLINQLVKLGARRQRLEAKVFGGGRVFGVASTIAVGERNADFVLKYLGTENIPVLAQDLRGDMPRKLYYFPATGKVLVRHIRKLNNNTLLTREQEYGLRLAQDRVAGDVELFV
jgi:chemotaxis protein CheD